MDAYDISASALTAHRLRLDTIASNLANMNTTRKADGSLGAYRKHNVVFAPILDNRMQGASTASSLPLRQSSLMTVDGARQMSMENGSPVLKASLTRTDMPGFSGVQVTQIVEDEKTPMRLVYDPSHPDANKDGYVEFPNINPVTEMVDMISATRAYEANVNSIQAARSMGKAAMEI